MANQFGRAGNAAFLKNYQFKFDCHIVSLRHEIFLKPLLKHIRPIMTSTMMKRLGLGLLLLALGAEISLVAGAKRPGNGGNNVYPGAAFGRPKPPPPRRNNDPPNEYTKTLEESEYFRDDMGDDFPVDYKSRGKSLELDEEDFKFKMPSLRSAVLDEDDEDEIDQLSLGKGRGALYDAYNQLHTLAQVRDFLRAVFCD